MDHASTHAAYPCSPVALRAQEFKSQRLHLRPWTRDDLQAMAHWPPFTAPLERSGNWAHTLAEQGTLDLFFWSRKQDTMRAAWTMHMQETIVGLLQISRIDPANYTAYLGIGFGAPWVGQGLGTAAMSAFLQGYFERCGWQSLTLEVALVNQRAHHLYEQLHFVETRRFWQDASGDVDRHVLQMPEYSQFAPYFRVAAGTIYQRCAEMQLTQANWRDHQSPTS